MNSMGLASISRSVLSILLFNPCDLTIVFWVCGDQSLLDLGCGGKPLVGPAKSQDRGIEEPTLSISKDLSNEFFRDFLVFASENLLNLIHSLIIVL